MLSFLFLLLFYGIGSWLHNRFFDFGRMHAFQRTFFRVLTGYITSIVLFALIQTRGESIFLGIPLLFLLLKALGYKDLVVSPSSKNQYQTQYSSFVTQLPQIILVIFAAHWWNLQWLYDLKNHVELIPHWDYLYYGANADFLNQHHTETNFLDVFGDEPLQPSLYHYGDLWLYAFISKLTGLNGNEVIFKTAIPLLWTMLWIGGCAIAEEIKDGKITFYDRLLSVGMIALCGLPNLVPFIDTNFNFSFYNAFNHPKHSIVALFLSASFILLLKKRYTAMVLPIALLGFFYTPTLPGAFAASWLASVSFIGFEKGNFKLKKIIHSSLILGFTTIFLGIFYWFTQKNGAVVISGPKPFQYTNEPNYLGVIWYLCKNVLKLTGFGLLPWLAWGLIFTPRNTLKTLMRKESVWLLYAFLFPLSAYLAFGYYIDGFQLFDTVFMSSLGIYLLYYLVKISDFSTYWYSKLLAIILVGYCFYYNADPFRNFMTEPRTWEFPVRVDADFYTKIQKEIKKPEELEKTAFIYGKEQYKSYYISTFCQVPAVYLRVLYPHYYPVNIGIYDMPFEIDGGDNSIFLRKMILKTSAFYRFAEQKKEEKSVENTPQLQVQYIENQNIKYLVLSSDALVDSLLKMKFEKVIKNEQTGEQFIILKK